MKALTYDTFGGPEVLQWVDVDEPGDDLGPSQILIRASAGGVNPKDVFLRRGRFSRSLARDPLPRVHGLDVAGTVVAVGPAVSDLSPGDAVYAMSNRFVGAVHAERVVLERDEAARAPTSIPVTAAAGVPLAAQTALQALTECASVSAGDRVLIIGCTGGVGHFAVQIAKALGAHVHGVCSAESADRARELGCDDVTDYRHRRASDIGGPFDVVFDVFGGGRLREFRQQLGRRGVYVSTVPRRESILGEGIARLRLSRRSRLVVVRSRQAQLDRLTAWIDAGDIVPRVDAVYPAVDAAQAHRHVERWHTDGKVVIDLAAG